MVNDLIDHNIHLTKKYAKGGFVPADLQWPVAEVAEDFTLYDLFRLIYQQKTSSISP